MLCILSPISFIAQCYEMEIGVAYQSDMSANDYIKTTGDVSIPAFADIKLFARDSVIFGSEFAIANQGILEVYLRDCQ